MSKFQIILLSIFGVFIVVAVMLFAFSRGGGGANDVTVVVWGDMSSFDFNAFQSATNIGRSASPRIEYVEKSGNTLETEFVEALASGAGPDLVLLPLDKFYKQRNKLLPIPYKSISERDFKTTFIEEAELFLDTTGIYALPLTVDPLVLYYNRDHLSTNNIAKPIAFWDEMYAHALNLTKRDPAGNIVKSAMALGESRNIKNYKEILSLLMLQAGTPVTGISQGKFSSFLKYNPDLPLVPSEAALDFFTQFSNPSKPYYSWNRSLVESQTRFAAGDSTYYLGFASELKALRNKNPTLNFSIAPVPKSRISDRDFTYGNIRALAIARSTKNPSASLEAALMLVSQDAQSALSEILNLPPVRRDLLSVNQPSENASVFYQSALQARGWVDPDDNSTDVIFREMIESVTSGRARTTEAINKANRELNSLF